MAKKKKLTIEVTGKAVDAIREFTKITRRKNVEVISDALRTYMWILFEQTQGATITAHHKDPKENRDLMTLVRDKKISKKYLEPFRHLFRTGDSA
ncbi:MAG: hypothetical protein HYW79_00545 [Parcubacteria group bacterium]|nr:hypothetical protein [Parcubacteria group bacterium]